MDAAQDVGCRMHHRRAGERSEDLEALLARIVRRTLCALRRRGYLDDDAPLGPGAELALMVRDVAIRDGRPDVEGMKLLAGVARRLVDLLPAPVKAEVLRWAGLAAERNVPVLGWVLSGLVAVPDAIELTRMLASGRATPEEVAFKAAELALDIAGVFGPIGAAISGAGGILLGLMRALLQAKRFGSELFGGAPDAGPSP